MHAGLLKIDRFVGVLQHAKFAKSDDTRDEVMQLKFDTAMFLSRSEVYDLKPFGSLSLRLLTLAQIGGLNHMHIL